MKKCLIILLALCLLQPMTRAYATEQGAVIREGQCGEDAWWSLSADGTLTIYGTGPMVDLEEQQPWEDLKTEITALVVGKEITYIGAGAFEDLDLLREVQLGEAVTELGTGAFRSCDGLRELKLPKGFKILGEESLRSCVLLHRIIFAGNMPKFKLNCLWDTTADLIYPATNPWPQEHIIQLEEAFQGRIEFLASDGTDPYISPIDLEEATAPTTEPEETEAPTTEPTQPPTTEPPTEPTEPATEAATEPRQEPVTEPTQAPAAQVTETIPEPVVTAAATEPAEQPRRSEGGGIGLAIVLGTLSLLMLGALIFGGRRNRGGKYSR